MNDTYKVQKFGSSCDNCKHSKVMLTGTDRHKQIKCFNEKVLGSEVDGNGICNAYEARGK